MQIAGPHLMIAAEAGHQAARAKAPSPAKPAATASFQPLNFAKAGPPAAVPQGAAARPGAQLDITV